MLTFASWIGYFLSFSLSTPLGFAIFFLSHATAGILHVQICLNHFAMDTIEGSSAYSEEKDFVNLQLGATTDIYCPKWLDWFFGGL
jgi:fatty acid desaturase